MYDKRIKIFVIISAALLLVCLLRLIQMQLLPDSSLQDEIEELKRQRGLSRQLKTIRGRILDRNGRVLALDEPQFNLHINYRLTSFADERVTRGKLLRAAQKNDPVKAKTKVQQEIQTKLEDLKQIIDKCTYFGLQRTDIEERIKNINNRIWNLRIFVAWARNGPDSNILKKYNHITDVPLSEAIADFEKKFPKKDERLERVSKVDDIADMDKSWPLLELKTDDDIFTAQLEFMDVDGVQILPKGHRFYPYGSVAAQTIGWVGPATQEQDRQLFANDKLARYLDDEVCGREDGVEYVCETILRGRRGQEDWDIDRVLKNRTAPQFGEDVRLSLDIELQKKIEDYLVHYDHDPNCGPGMAAVIIQVGTGDILALVSLPVFDLNNARQNYDELKKEPKPLINRAINQWYPPGSVIKPLILIAGLESGKITADEIIPCPAKKAPKGWPSCWLYNKYPWMGHDDKGENSARNAIMWSCNIYFSRLADRINSSVLQQWLFQFGYGRSILQPPAHNAGANSDRNFRQLSGVISSDIPKGTISRFEQIPPLEKRERRWFGIGQGKLLATPLQVANAMAAIARGGIYKTPRLFIHDPNNPNSATPDVARIDLDISPATLATVFDGMGAVVNESGGTANKQFAQVLASLAQQDVKLYGKTGSTQPANAWFAGFAKDATGRCIAIAVVVEGGQRGSSDAGPLARDIIQFCIEAGYIGDTGLTTE